MKNQTFERTAKISRFSLLSNKIYLCHLSSVCIYNFSREIFDTERKFSLFFVIKLDLNGEKCVFKSRAIRNNFNPVWSDIQLNEEFELKTTQFFISIYGSIKGEPANLLGTYHIYLVPKFCAKKGIPTSLSKNDGLLLSLRGIFYFFPRIYEISNFEGISGAISCDVPEEKAIYSCSRKTLWILQNQEQIIKNIQSRIKELLKEIQACSNEAVVRILEDENIERNGSYLLLRDVLKSDKFINCVFDSDYSYLISKIWCLRSEIIKTGRKNVTLRSLAVERAKASFIYKEKIPETQNTLNDVVKKIKRVKNSLSVLHNQLETSSWKNYIKKQKMFTYLFQIYPFYSSVQNRVINKLFCGIPMPSVFQNKYPSYNYTNMNVPCLGPVKSNILLTASTSYACFLTQMIFMILDVKPIFPILFKGSSSSIRDIVNGKRYNISHSLEQLSYAYTLLCVNLRQLCRVLDVEDDKENNIFNTLYRIINRMSEPKTNRTEHKIFNLAAELFMERLSDNTLVSSKSYHDDLSDVSGETAKSNINNSPRPQEATDILLESDNPDTYLNESVSEIAARINSQINF